MNSLLSQNREWLIQPDALRSMIAAADSFRALGNPVVRDPSSSSLLSVEGGVATVSIHGPIVRKPDIFARVLMGATDSQEIRAAIQEAASRDDIKAVFLDIDSPGGTVAGTPELTSAVASLVRLKPVYAFSSGLMASAVCWIASQARGIYATVIRVVTAPRTGLSIQVRDRYDGSLGKQEVSFTLMHGFATGNKPAIERITRPV